MSKFTSIHDLPDLRDVENNMNMENYSNKYPLHLQDNNRRDNNNMHNTTSLYDIIPEEQASKYNKVIRPSMNIPEEAGMKTNKNIAYNVQPSVYENNNIQNNENELLTTGEILQNEQKEIKDKLSCLDFANHYSQCHICRKYYNDRQLYIIIIVMLIIICLILYTKK
jgi:hypothetical protein